MKSRITIADVAQAAGVSAQTVSRVLNNKGEISASTRQAVLDVIQRLGYRPSSIARSLATNRTLTLGLSVPDISNPFFSDIARGVEDSARAQGYNVFLCNTVEDLDQEEAVLRILEDKRVDGVVLCSARLPDERLVPLLQQHQAAVLINRSVPDGLVGSVRVDDAEGTRQAVQHLLSRQRGTLALLAGPTTAHSSRERVHGFRMALAAAGYSPNEALIVPCQPTLQGGVEATHALLAAHPEVDALICYNDLVAVGAIQVCCELGLDVPGQMAVVGCDDILLASLVTPALTTLWVSKYELGAAAVQMLLDRIQGRVDQTDIVLQPELVVRVSAP